MMQMMIKMPIMMIKDDDTELNVYVHPSDSYLIR
jgi:hypothetical protein